jgi:hypothetical protein
VHQSGAGNLVTAPFLFGTIPAFSAGTRNPHLPKRTIAPTLMLEWLKEPS